MLVHHLLLVQNLVVLLHGEVVDVAVRPALQPACGGHVRQTWVAPAPEPSEQQRSLCPEKTWLMHTAPATALPPPTHAPTEQLLFDRPLEVRRRLRLGLPNLLDALRPRRHRHRLLPAPQRQPPHADEVLRPRDPRLCSPGPCHQAPCTSKAGRTRTCVIFVSRCLFLCTRNWGQYCKCSSTWAKALA